ncbi:MAG: hypothetical protein AB7K09_17475 [Planctomycetota bacterium]
MSANGRHAEPIDPGDELIDQYLIELHGAGTPPDLTDRILRAAAAEGLAMSTTPGTAPPRTEAPGRARNQARRAHTMTTIPPPTDNFARPLGWAITATLSTVAVMALLAMMWLMPPGEHGRNGQPGQPGPGPAPAGPGPGDNTPQPPAQTQTLDPATIPGHDHERVLMAIPAAWQAILASAATFELISLDPMSRPVNGNGNGNGSLSAHKEIGKLTISDLAERRRMLTLLYASIIEGNHVARSRVAPWPIHAIRAGSGDDAVEMVISYRTSMAVQHGAAVKGTDLSMTCEAPFFRLLLAANQSAWTEQGHIPPFDVKRDEVASFRFNSDHNSVAGRLGSWDVRSGAPGELIIEHRVGENVTTYPPMKLADSTLLWKLLILSYHDLRQGAEAGEPLAGPPTAPPAFRLEITDEHGNTKRYAYLIKNAQMHTVIRSLLEYMVELIKAHTGKTANFNPTREEAERGD